MGRNRKLTTVTPGSKKAAPVKNTITQSIADKKASGAQSITQKEFIDIKRQELEKQKDVNIDTLHPTGITITQLNALLLAHSEKTAEKIKEELINGTEHIEKDIKALKRASRATLIGCGLLWLLVGAVVYFFVKESKNIPA